jgi:hypothetical protein
MAAGCQSSALPAGLTMLLPARFQLTTIKGNAPRFGRTDRKFRRDLVDLNVSRRSLCAHYDALVNTYG